jgi:hypothetical protein
MSLGSCTALPDDRSATPATPVESSLAPASEAVIKSCRSHILSVVPQVNLEITEVEPQPDDIFHVNWQTDSGEKGYCEVNQSGSVIRIVGEQRSPVEPDKNPFSPAPRANTTPNPTQRPANSRATRLATLVASDPNSQINIRSEPSTEADALNYGMVGDAVEILEETKGEDGFTWYRISLEDADVSGWVRGDLVRQGNNRSQNRSDRPSARVPLAAIDGCRTEAAEKFETNQADIEIMNSQLSGADTYKVLLRSEKTGMSADCQVSETGDVTAFETQTASPESRTSATDEVQVFGELPEIGVGSFEVVLGTTAARGELPTDEVREFDAFVDSDRQRWWADCITGAIGVGEWTASDANTADIANFVCAEPL